MACVSVVISIYPKAIDDYLFSTCARQCLVEGHYYHDLLRILYLLSHYTVHWAK